jgi:hypothetical protein
MNYLSALKAKMGCLVRYFKPEFVASQHNGLVYFLQAA